MFIYQNVDYEIKMWDLCTLESILHPDDGAETWNLAYVQRVK